MGIRCMSNGQKGLLIDRTEPIYYALRQSQQFTCTVIIHKKIDIPKNLEKKNHNRVKYDHQKSTRNRGNNNRHRRAETERDEREIRFLEQPEETCCIIS